MRVKDLIALLEEVEDKEKKIVYETPDYDGEDIEGIQDCDDIVWLI